MIIKVKRIIDKFNDIPLPSYSTEGSSGMDVRAAIEENIILHSLETMLIPTNLIFDIPLGYEAQIRPRSGLAAKSFIGILNSPGTIDSDYRGELKIILTNFGKEDFVIHRGDRIAQIIFSKVEKVSLIETDNISDTTRNSGGFGHTGIK